MQVMMNFSRFFHENFNVIWCVAIFLGLWTVLAQIYRFMNFIYAKLIRKRKNLQERYGKGTWVLITGSSQGIGKAFAHAFAKQGFNILLSARTQSKLKQVQQQIKSLYPAIQVKYIVIDLLKSVDKQQIQSTWYKTNKLSQLDIGIVVNNAGIDYLDKICDQDFKTLFKMVEMDCLVVNSIQYLFMEKWLKEEKKDQEKKRRLIINVSSLCAESPISNFAVYNASKIYVDRLTQGCAKEHPQMDFMALRPSEVSTKMTAFKKDIFTIQPHQCVQPLLDDLGYQVISHGNFFHAIQSWLYLTVPFWLFTLLWQGIFLKEFKKARVEFKEKSEKSK